MKQGDLARVSLRENRFYGKRENRFHGKIALVVGGHKRAGETEYVQVICDGIRMMPFFWLEPVE